MPLPTATFAIDRPAPGVAVVAIEGELDVYSAPDLRDTYVDLINEARFRQVFDLSGVTRIDSSGLGVIVGALKRARAHGGNLALVVELESSVGQALRVAGVHETIPHAPTVEGALELLTPKGAETASAEPDPGPSFWPPRVGDVWLGQLDERVPMPLTCTGTGRLYGGGDFVPAERASDAFGPLRLVWRDGAVVTAMHSSELAEPEG